ncbi:unnamed protein product [Arctia plantaginis]|uniref:Double jelly roll-like domain-containing protein n=1 Tax=Arctia plantaginis TaxID=874455 RepID=A0A8S1BMQ0_ARCPL|nr:unnamed protein product [Arctia plantaginis]
MILTDDIAQFHIDVQRVQWKVPYTKVSDRERLTLLKHLERDKPIQMVFRHWDLYEYPLPPKGTKLSCCIKHLPTFDNIIVIGDINIDIQSNRIDPITTKYRNTLCAYGLQCVIPSGEITREAIVEGQFVASCLDHVWVRAGRSECGSSSFVWEAHISDHHAVGIALELRASANLCLPVGSVNSARQVICDKLVKHKMDAYDWSQLLVNTCPLMMFQSPFACGRRRNIIFRIIMSFPQYPILNVEDISRIPAADEHREPANSHEVNHIVRVEKLGLLDHIVRVEKLGLLDHIVCVEDWGFWITFRAERGKSDPEPPILPY